MKLSILGFSARQACLFVLVALTIAVPAVSAQGLSSARYIPHIAQGRGWTTELHVFNVCSSPSVYRIFFYGSDGYRKAFLLEGAGDLQQGPERVDHIAGSEGQEIDREVHVWRFVDTGQELLQGFGRILQERREDQRHFGWRLRRGGYLLQAAPAERAGFKHGDSASTLVEPGFRACIQQHGWL